jgi:hypothetical protein
MHSKNQKLTKSLLEMAGDEQFIPGICNFCNRWCERCSKGQNCLSYAYDQVKKGIDLETNNHDQENKEFWNTIEKILAADINGLIANSLNVTREISSQDLFGLGETYQKMVNQWLTESAKLLSEKENLIVTKYSTDKIILFSDAIEIIKWYNPFISKRISRSLNELNERKAGDLKDPSNPYRDNIGSAKNTIIACGHSIAAFSLLYPDLETQQSKIQNFVRQLVQIKNQLLELFPDVMEFKRPGFDK